MERLTERSLDYCTQLCSDEDAISCAFYKGEQEEKCWRANMYDRLAAYEDLEGQGRLVVLPCKVGDELWFEKNGKIQCETIDRMVVDLTDEDDDWYIAIYTMSASVLSEDIGRLAWLTRAEAEDALEGGSEDD